MVASLTKKSTPFLWSRHCWCQRVECLPELQLPPHELPLHMHLHCTWTNLYQVLHSLKAHNRTYTHTRSYIHTSIEKENSSPGLLGKAVFSQLSENMRQLLPGWSQSGHPLLHTVLQSGLIRLIFVKYLIVKVVLVKPKAKISLYS